MNSIIEKLTLDIRKARLDGEKNKLDILVVLKNDIAHGLSQKQAVKPQKTVANLLLSYKQTQALLRDSDAIQRYQEKIEIIESYLETGKTQLDTNALTELLSSSNFSSIKEWMSFLKTNYEGQFDGKLAASLYNGGNNV